MAGEVNHRHSATGETLYATIRKPVGTYWNTAGTPNFETLAVANWGDYDIALTESPASSYFYIGTFPAISGNMVAGWYWVDVFKRAGGSPAIGDTLQASYFGYWDGTTYKWWGEDTVALGGTVQTGRDIGASVLLSAGTGAGQLDFTSGVVKSNLVQILATVLTETIPGYIAAAFKKFFDIASPTSTANRITLVDTCTANTDMRGTDNAALATNLATLLTRLSETRAGYLDWLNTGGLVASQADIQGITQAQRVRVLPSPQMERPDSGSTAFRVWIYVYNELHQAEDLDAIPTVTAENNAGTDRSANLGTVTKPGGTTGQYYVDYTVADTHAIEGLVFKVAAVEGAVTTNYAAASIVTDTTAVDFTSADRSKLEALNTDWTDGGRLDLLIDALLARMGAITGSGDNTLLGFFKAALNKAAATPTDIGGTFSPATDSIEAIRDTAPMGTEMRGTDGANTTTPPTVAEVRTEIDSNSTQLALLKKLLEADMFVDTSNPAQYVLRIREKGTTTDLLVKNLKSIAGAAITNTTTIVGQEINAA